MSVNPPDRWVGLTAVVRRSVDDLRAFLDGLMEFYRELGATPDRISYFPPRMPKAGSVALTTKRIDALAAEPLAKVLMLETRGDGPAGQGQFYLRDDPKAAEFEWRWSGAIAHGSLNTAALRSLARLFDERFGLISAGLMSHAGRSDMAREVLDGIDRRACTPALVERVEWDRWKWHKSHTKLRRLYPVTIIGPDIWAQLPSMPAFDPMPTIEDLGNCKLLTAWPTLCPPRDPAFLRGTRALREWLWPYTIQNPADHVDNDPPE